MLGRRDPLANPEPLIRRVYSYAAYRLGDGPDAEDATSETLLRAVRYRESYRASSGTEQMWLLGIAQRVVGERLVARSNEDRGMPGAVLLADNDLEATVERLELRDALTRLSQQERDLLALRYGADLAVSDVARILEERTNTVEVALHRIIEKLRVHMGAESSRSRRPDAG
jgi:RNA polymerase sigma-70 factor, ECF subfamily